MNEDVSTPPASNRPAAARSFPLLEKITSLVLMLVLLALAAIVVMAYNPAAARLLGEPAAVLVLVGLLFAALVLVSAVALLHTQ